MVTFGHGYNAANQRTAETASDTAWLAYPAATPATTGYAANALNQYTAVGAVTPAYDGNANLTFDGTMTLGHDPENRLVSATGGGNTAAYAFDPRGRRKVRTVNGTTTVTITGADNRELLDYDGSNGAILRWYAYGPGPNAVLSQMNVASGTRDTLLPDLLGSIVASVDSGTGTLSPFGYRPYGTASAAPAQFDYTGQRVDAETGLYYYRARHYSPQWGRFTQADPIGYQGGINLYGYVGNDPLNNIDPTGQILNFIVGGAIGFTVDLTAQILISGTYDYRQGLLATGSGALTAGVSAAIATTSLRVGGQLAANAAVGAAANTAQTAALNAWSGQSASLGQAALFGAGFGAAGFALGSAANKSITSASGALSQSRFDSMSLSNKLFAIGIAETNKAIVGGPTPLAVSFGAALGNLTSNALGNATSFVSPEQGSYDWSLIGTANATAVSGGK